MTILPSQLIELTELPDPIEDILPFSISNDVFLIVLVPLALAVTSFPMFLSTSDLLLILDTMVIT